MKIRFNNNNVSVPIYLILLFIMGFSVIFLSCKKYLDEKPDRKLSTPSTLQDLEKLLDNYDMLNTRFSSIGEISADNYYLTDEDWKSVDEYERNFYLWQKYDGFGGAWLAPYNNIFKANIILETLKTLNSDADNNKKNQIEGSALFIRAFNHFYLSQLFASPYIESSAQMDLGIPLRVNSDLETPSVRSSVMDTYTLILSDLKRSILLLYEKPIKKYLPSRAAAYALLARVYLTMNDYNNAGVYADSTLQLYNNLIDYNNIDIQEDVPFELWNTEVIYDAQTVPTLSLFPTIARIDTSLYAFYDNNDLRKNIFFTADSEGNISFKGHYTGSYSSALFIGLATDEIYFVKAECLARAGKIQEANNWLNTLMYNRWNRGTFTANASNDINEVLETILKERRKELLFRCLRWSDLRRLNQDPMFSRKLVRKIEGKEYILDPGSPRYTFQISRDAVIIGGLEQNP